MKEQIQIFGEKIKKNLTFCSILKNFCIIFKQKIYAFIFVSKIIKKFLSLFFGSRLGEVQLHLCLNTPKDIIFLVLNVSKPPTWLAVVISSAVGILSAVAIQLAKPRLKKWIKNHPSKNVHKNDEFNLSPGFTPPPPPGFYVISVDDENMNKIPLDDLKIKPTGAYYVQPKLNRESFCKQIFNFVFFTT